MDHGIIVYPSIAVANRAKRLADGRAGSMEVIQLPAGAGMAGCNYSIRCKHEDIDILRAIGAEHGMQIKAVFLERLQEGKRVYTRI